MPAPRPRRPLLAASLLVLCACGSMATPPAPAVREGATTVGDAAGTDTADAATLRTLSLRPGEQAALDGGSLRYLRLLNDSRCAPDVQCVWAGDAEIALAWTPTGGASRTFSLHTGVAPRQQMLDRGRSLHLVELARDPAPAARLEVRATP